MSQSTNGSFLGFKVTKDLNYDLWKPEIDEQKAVKVERIQEQPGKKENETFEVCYGTDLQTGVAICFVMGAVLSSVFKQNNIKSGDAIGVTYNGKVKTKSGEMANHWDCCMLDETMVVDDETTTPEKGKSAGAAGKGGKSKK